MGDFYQNGLIATLHQLGERPLEDIEAELKSFSAQRPMALVLPCLYSELEGPALSHIVDTLQQISYISEVVVGLDAANRQQFEHARKYFSRLPQSHVILWQDGPRLQSLDEDLAKQGLAPLSLGKGRNVWYCYGYLLAAGHAEAVAQHDCDILTYRREMVARLFYPVVHPTFNYKFCKGYYYRSDGEKLNGRVTRLLVTPLIRALKTIIGDHEYLNYIDSFRYPLSGEFAMRVDVLSQVRIPSDWGLEIGVLSEVERNYSTNRICQVDIANAYDHKHQVLSADDMSTGLTKMSLDIAKAIFRKLATNGVVFSAESFRTVKATYYRIALDFVDQYYRDATINGLAFDRHAEEQTVEVFSDSIMRAGYRFLDNPMEKPFIPSWNRIASAKPALREQLLERVLADNA